MSELKLNTLLAKTDHLGSVYAKATEENFKFFKNNQGAFKGERRTYEAKPGVIEKQNGNSVMRIVTTVDEKLLWYTHITKEYIDSVFSMERTNASGFAKARLVVGEIDFGEYTSLELMRLKSILENGMFKEMYENIPVRSENEFWDTNEHDDYKNRTTVFQSKLHRGVDKTTVKESYILPNPDIGKNPNYNPAPMLGQKDTVMELGEYTHQRFSGEWSHRQKAELLQRRTLLLSAVIAALKVANEVPAVESQLKAEMIFCYLHTGQL